MVATEAIEMLKREAKAEDGLYVGIALTRDEYDALLALLDGLRLRSVKDEPPPFGTIALFYGKGLIGHVRHVTHSALAMYADDKWLPLSSILPGDA